MGKTSIVEALARRTGHSLVRVNLSDQTDLADLFGADLPAAGGGFAWRDGVLLAAVKAGAWVLLDELNLAPQPVLEGLNALLDHRRSVFVPALGLTVSAPPSFRCFAAQNPLAQGGGRKGLPASFLNRFTKVAVAPLRSADLAAAAATLFPALPPRTRRAMVRTLRAVATDARAGRVGRGHGTPLDVNLRDLQRWAEIAAATGASPAAFPGAALQAALLARLARAPADAAVAASRWLRSAKARGGFPLDGAAPILRVTKCFFALDDAVLPRAALAGAWAPRAALIMTGESAALAAALAAPGNVSRAAADARAQMSGGGGVLLPPSLRRAAAAAAAALAAGAPVLLVGGPGTGKTTVARALATLAGARLRVVTLTPVTDAGELVGGFEQDASSRVAAAANDEVEGVARGVAAAALDLAKGGGEGLALALARAAHGVAAVVTAALAARVAAHDADGSAVSAATAALAETVERGVASLVAAGVSAPLASQLASASLAACAAAARAAAARAEPRGAFAWADGDLVAALVAGEWLLLQGAHSCAPAVLDRLNALLEPRGALLVHEAGPGLDGLPRTVVPHVAARVMLAMTPGGGASRALRNRCVEVALPDVGRGGGEVPKSLLW